MPLATSRGVGLYVASEAHSFAFGTLYRKDATRRPIIYFTGGPGDDRNFLTAVDSGSHLPPTLVEKGYPIISAAFGGTGQWGNPTSVTRIGQAWTYVKPQLNTKTDKFIGIGVSKGTTALLNYTKDNAANVAALALFLPCADLLGIYNGNLGGNAATISTAYGGAPPSSSDPLTNVASFTGIPMKLWYASDDTTATAAAATTFASGAGATTVNMGAVGHTAANVASDTLLNFIEAYR